jgi:DNA replication protein DnaC
MKQAPDWLGGTCYCPVCAEAQAAIERDRLAKEEQERQESVKRAQVRRYLADSCIGERFRGLAFTDYRPVCAGAAKVLQACREFVADFRVGCGVNLVFVGSPGTGKNMLSAIIGQELMDRGFSFLHTTAVKVVRRFKDSWKTPGVTEEEVLRYFVTPDLLVIDEVGVQFGSATEQLYLTEVINDRYESRRSTILLSNLTMKQIEETLGVRAVERFHEDSSRVLVFDWQSYRRGARSA